ncbi:hypothetical protein T03_7925 [Trichinella britovi]|uniref:Uncharacterized protein n=1 Tax=Trichinella britovi TaxID=45882 RepID=A0A0V1CCC4_TRIBR|nr:hypothetical protein T03_7925 [Trichinella britovi]
MPASVGKSFVLNAVDLAHNNYCRTFFIVKLVNKTSSVTIFVSQRTDISQYTKGDATRSSAQIIMTNTDCE